MTEHFGSQSFDSPINISKGEFYDLWIHPQKHRETVL